MTIIVGLKVEDKYILACDSRMTQGTAIISESFNKIHRDEHFNIACAGQIGEFNRLIRTIRGETDTQDISSFKVRGKEDESDLGLDAIIITLNDYSECVDVAAITSTTTGTEAIGGLHSGYMGDLIAIGSGSTAFINLWRLLHKRGQRFDYNTEIKKLKECFKVVSELDNCCNNNIQIITYDIES